MSARLLIAATFVFAMLGASHGQTPAPQSTAELARTIADGIRATTRTQPGAPISLASATSHDNVVEVRYAVTDAAAFARFKANVERARLAMTAFYCNDVRRPGLTQGLVFHQVYAMSDGSDQVEFTIDASSCDRLQKAPVVGAKALAVLALAAAEAENAQAPRSDPALLFAGATAHDNVVDVRHTVADPAAARQDLSRLVSVLASYYCIKYGGSISQGLAIHPIIAPASGPPIFEFIIDRTKC
jgi:hypothetical protein